jgi:hypothetical protein
MLTPQDQEALRLYNVGVDLAQAGQSTEATRVWKEALAQTNALGLEVMIRSNLVVSLTHDIYDLPMGATLGDEQAARFKEAEQSLIRLNQLCLGQAPEGPVDDLPPDGLAQYRAKTKKLTLDFARRIGRGYWYLPNGESGPRMVDFGWTVADAKMFDVAEEALTKAVAILDPQTQSRHLQRAHARLATISNDRGRREDATTHAKAALAAGLQMSDNEMLYVAMNAIIEAGGERSPYVSGPEKQKSGCFIVTAACGSSMAPEVLVLSRFRDAVLMRSPRGRAFTRIYYACSPRAATFIAHRPVLRTWVRHCVVRPAVYFVKRFG